MGFQQCRHGCRAIKCPGKDLIHVLPDIYLPVAPLWRKGVVRKADQFEVVVGAMLKKRQVPLGPVAHVCGEPACARGVFSQAGRTDPLRILGYKGPRHGHVTDRNGAAWLLTKGAPQDFLGRDTGEDSENPDGLLIAQTQAVELEQNLLAKRLG